MDEDKDGDQSQEGCFEVQRGPADYVEGNKISWGFWNSFLGTYMMFAKMTIIRILWFLLWWLSLVWLLWYFLDVLGRVKKLNEKKQLWTRLCTPHSKLFFWCYIFLYHFSLFWWKTNTNLDTWTNNLNTNILEMNRNFSNLPAISTKGIKGMYPGPAYLHVLCIVYTLVDFCN